MSFKKGVTPVFDKKWWEKNRPLSLHGSGVGKGLEAWAKVCAKKAAGDLKKRQEFADAFEACELLKVGLAKAKKKAGKDKDSADVIDKYEAVRAKYEQVAKELYENKLTQFKADREELKEFCKAAEARMKVHLAEMQKFDKYLEGTEEEMTTDANENGGAMAKMYYDQATPAANAVKNQLKKATEEYERDGVFIKERRGGAYNAESYGISAEDGAKLAPIFNEATKLSANATNLYNTIVALSKNSEDSHLAIVSLFAQGKKGLKDVTEDVKKAVANAKKLVKEVDVELGKAKSSLEYLGEWAKTPPIKDEYDSVPIHVQKLESHGARITQTYNEADTFCKKVSKRIPNDMKSDRTLKPHFDQLRTTHLEAISLKKRWDTALEQAYKDAEKVTKAGPAVPKKK